MSLYARGPVSCTISHHVRLDFNVGLVWVDLLAKLLNEEGGVLPLEPLHAHPGGLLSKLLGDGLLGEILDPLQAGQVDLDELVGLVPGCKFVC